MDRKSVENNPIASAESTVADNNSSISQLVDIDEAELISIESMFSESFDEEQFAISNKKAERVLPSLVGNYRKFDKSFAFVSPSSVLFRQTIDEDLELLDQLNNTFRCNVNVLMQSLRENNGRIARLESMREAEEWRRKCQNRNK